MPSNPNWLGRRPKEHRDQAKNSMTSLAFAPLPFWLLPLIAHFSIILRHVLTQQLYVLLTGHRSLKITRLPLTPNVSM